MKNVPCYAYVLQYSRKLRVRHTIQGAREVKVDNFNIEFLIETFYSHVERRNALRFGGSPLLKSVLAIKK